jgi:transposase
VPRRRVNVIGALADAKGQLWYEVHEQTVRRENVVDLIDRVARRAEAKALTVVVLDNASMHHGIDPEQLDDWLISHRLILMHLPPYSPELNLIEIVWKQAKYHWRRFETWAKDQVRAEVVQLMQGFGSTYQISYA